MNCGAQQEPFYSHYFFASFSECNFATPGLGALQSHGWGGVLFDQVYS